MEPTKLEPACRAEKSYWEENEQVIFPKLKIFIRNGRPCRHHLLILNELPLHLIWGRDQCREFLQPPSSCFKISASTMNLDLFLKNLNWGPYNSLTMQICRPFRKIMNWVNRQSLLCWGKNCELLMIWNWAHRTAATAKILADQSSSHNMTDWQFKHCVQCMGLPFKNSQCFQGKYTTSLCIFLLDRLLYWHR